MYHIKLYNLVLTYIINPSDLLSLQFIELFVSSSSCTTLSNGSLHISSFKTPCLFHVILLLVILHPCLPFLGNIFCLLVFKYSFYFSWKPLPELYLLQLADLFNTKYKFSFVNFETAGGSLFNSLSNLERLISMKALAF